jgi:hypothetical protein
VPPEEGGIFVGVTTLLSLPMVKFRSPWDGLGIASHIKFSPIIPSSGEAVLEWAKVSRAICEEHVFYDFSMHESHVIFVNFMTFENSNKNHRDVMSTIFAGLFREGKARGYRAYRSHINFTGRIVPAPNTESVCSLLTVISDTIAGFHEFNNHDYRRFVERLKVC